ncbi:MAG: MMPL family transporter [Actinomycetia bacterium]|nr:MMPL family transporter [Actinomycetes bacterium]
MARRRKRLIVGWLVAAVFLAGGFAANFSENLTAVNGSTPGSESARVITLLEENFGIGVAEQDLVVFESDSLSVDDDRFMAVVANAITVVEQQVATSDIISPLDPDGAGQISADRRAAFVSLSIAGTPSQRQSEALELNEALAAIGTDGVDVWLTGESPLHADVDAVAQSDLAKAEMIGLPVALVVLLLAFGALVAAGLPLLLGGVGIGVSFGVLGLLSYFTEFSLLTENITTLIGLGVGIDFAMFIVSRFREGLDQGDSPERAAQLAVATSGRSVLYSGLTTIVAMAGLFLLDSPIFHDLAIAVMITVAVMVAAALTLLPAVLAALGHSVNRGRMPRWMSSGDGAERRWAWITTKVMKRPGTVAVAGGVLVLSLAAPALGLELGMNSGADAVADQPSGKGLAVLGENFGEGWVSPIEVVFTANDGRFDAEVASVNTFLDELGRDADVAGAGIETNVGGLTAGVIDQVDEMSAKLPLIITLVLAVSFVLLLAVFGSSMDYELFLLGRMREEWERTGDNATAVAAAIQAAIFGAFAFTSVIDVQQVGVALASAILIDATLVRALLVPASMKLMGRWNWWRPRWFIGNRIDHQQLRGATR